MNFNEENFKKIISEILNLSVEKINDDLSRDSAKDWDSFNHLLLVSAIEKDFNMKFTLKEITEIKTVGEIKRIIKEKNP